MTLKKVSGKNAGSFIAPTCADIKHRTIPVGMQDNDQNESAFWKLVGIWPFGHIIPW